MGNGNERKGEFMSDLKNDKQHKKKINKKVIIPAVLIFIISNVGFFYLGNKLAFRGVSLGNVDENVKKDLSSIENTDKYKLLFQVRDSLLSKYDGEIDDNKLLEAAIKGMTLSLNDPYTVYMNKDEYKSFMEQSQGEFVGIGIQVGAKDDKVTIVTPLEGSPAEEVGIKAGDVILKVNDTEVQGPDIDRAIAMIKGEKGTEVKLTLDRDGSEPFNVNVRRDVVKMVSVKGEMIDSSIGYIRMTSFDEDVSKDFEEKITELEANGMKGLIFDLRGNPGGYLNEAVKVASQFIPSGKIITYTIDKFGNKIESKSIGGKAEGMPLVLLVDKGSASASEVVTGALRDYDAATIVGVNTFGKGVVQQLLEFKGGEGGLKVTTSKYYTPNGENIHKVGIKPDVEVKIEEKLLNQPYNRDTDPQFQKALEVVKGKLK